MRCEMKTFAARAAVGLCMGIAAGAALAQSAHTSPEWNRIPPNMRGDGASLESKPFSITRSDPGLDALLSRQAKLELLGDRFGLTEGPVWIADGKSGFIVVADLIENVFFKIMRDHKTSVFLENA